MLKKCKYHGTSKVDLIPLRFSKDYLKTLTCPGKLCLRVGVGYVLKCPHHLTEGRILARGERETDTLINNLFYLPKICSESSEGEDDDENAHVFVE